MMRRCTLWRQLVIERGTSADWHALAPLHYRGHSAGAVTDVFRLVYVPAGGPGAARGLVAPLGRPRLVGVIVYSRSPLSLGVRDRATGGRHRLAGMGRLSLGRLVNRELRMISRVVIAPNWRGLGLARRLVAETMPRVGTPYVEALAAMGQVHPFFEQAGMTAHRPAPSAAGERLTAALEAAGLTRADRRSADALAAAIDRLPAALRRLAEDEIRRWARSYLGAKNHRTNRPSRRRTFELVARHLDAAPVYYLWRNDAAFASGPSQGQAVQQT